MVPKLLVINLGPTDYMKTYNLQEHLRKKRREGKISDALILVEHPHVYTIGRAGGWDFLLAPIDYLQSRSIPVIEVDRGGSITYHGPGQLVGYPILDLRIHGFDLHNLLRRYELSLQKALEHFGLYAKSLPGLTGVWVGDAKIAAIGVGVRERVTYHGFALNVDPDLTYFDLIIPCGIKDKKVTSMAQELGCPVKLEEVIPVVAKSFAEVFNLKPEFVHNPHEVIPFEINISSYLDKSSVAS